jgi:diacylglycerol O-acyltransferase / wax synthase
MDRLSTLDAAFLHFEHPSTPMHVAGLYLFEGAPEIEGLPGLAGVFRMVEERLPLVPRYRQRVRFVPFGLGYPVWVDDPDFDLSYHLRRAALPAPGGMRELLDYVARIHARPLDRSRPLWEIYVIEGLAGDRMALYSKVHHAMVDGIAGIDLGTILLDTDPAGQPGPPPRPFRPRPIPGSLEMVREVVQRNAAAAIGGVAAAVRRPSSVPATIAEQVASAAGLRRFAGLLRFVPPGPLNVPVGAHRRISLVHISLARAKAIKNGLGGTVNDVVLTAVGEAIETFLRHRNVPHEEETYRIFVPVSVRDESERMTLGNRVSGMFIDLPVGPMPARRRLAAVTRAMAGIKESGQAVAAASLLSLTGWAPATLHALAGRAGFSNQRLFNLVVSNVPGVQFPLYAGGARLLETYPLLPLTANLATVVCVSSYDGGLYFGLVGDYDAIPDLDILARGLRQGFDRLEMAAHTATRRGPPQPRRAVAARLAAEGAARERAATVTEERTGIAYARRTDGKGGRGPRRPGASTSSRRRKTEG